MKKTTNMLHIAGALVVAMVVGLFTGSSYGYNKNRGIEALQIEIVFLYGSRPTTLCIIEVVMDNDSGWIKKAEYPIMELDPSWSKVKLGLGSLGKKQIADIVSRMMDLEKENGTFQGFGELNSCIKPASLKISASGNISKYSFSVYCRKFPSQRCFKNYTEAQMAEIYSELEQGMVNYAQLVNYIDSIAISLKSGKEMEKTALQWATEIYSHSIFEDIRSYLVSSLGVYGIIPEGALESSFESVRGRAWVTYFEIAGEKALSEAMQMAADSNDLIRSAAIKALGNYGDPADENTIRILQDATNDYYFSVKNSAEESLKKLLDRGSRNRDLE